MSELGARDREKLAERMIPVGAALACAVRDREAAEIGELLDGYGRQELYALAVALAAMVPVDAPVGDLLAWATPEVLSRKAARAAERRREYARLRNRGVSLEDAAERLSVSVRTVERYEREWQAQREVAA